MVNYKNMESKYEAEVMRISHSLNFQAGLENMKMGTLVTFTILTLLVIHLSSHIPGVYAMNSCEDRYEYYRTVENTPNYARYFVMNDTNVSGRIIWCGNETDTFCYNDGMEEFACYDSGTRATTYVDYGNASNNYGTLDPNILYWSHMNDTGCTDTSIYSRPVTSYDLSVAPGKIGNGIYFDKSDDACNLHDVDAMEGVTSLSWSAWVLPSTGLSGDALVMGKGNGSSGGSNEWFMYESFDYNLFSCFVRTTSNCQTDPAIYEDEGRWYYVACVFDGDTLKLFVNGTLIATADCANGPIATSAYSVGIGAEIRSTLVGDWGGIIDEVMIENRAVSDEEWAARYANTKPTGYSTLGEEEICVPDEENLGRNAIVQGINNALTNSTTHTNQKIYIRYFDGTQAYGMFDKVAIVGNQTWAFNYVTDGESYTNMESLGNTVNVWENDSLTGSEISQQVENFIVQTKL